jgi:hypothetical protein
MTKAAPSGPATATIPACCAAEDPSPNAARRATRATPTASSPATHGPASAITPSRWKGAMNSGQPGVYCEKSLPWYENTQ